LVPPVADGTNQPRWPHHGGLAGAGTDTGQAVSHVPLAAGETERETDRERDRERERERERERGYFESDPSFRQRLSSCQEP